MLVERIIGAFTFRRQVYADVEQDTKFTMRDWLLVAVVAFLNQLGCPGRIFPSIRLHDDTMVSHGAASGGRDVVRPIREVHGPPQLLVISTDSVAVDSPVVRIPLGAICLYRI